MATSQFVCFVFGVLFSFTAAVEAFTGGRVLSIFIAIAFAMIAAVGALS
jgi:hypothetical protein